MTDHERALEIVVVEPTCVTLPKRVRDAYPWCVRIFRFELSRQVTRARAESRATRVRNLLAAALAAVRAEEREAERERCIVRARDAIACPHCADHEDTCMSREEMETRIADAIRRKP